MSPRCPHPPVHPQALGPGRAVPVNTSSLTYAFFLYDFSCFDETLFLAVQVPQRGSRPWPSQPVIQELCSQAQPHTLPNSTGRNLPAPLE